MVQSGQVPGNGSFGGRSGRDMYMRGQQLRLHEPRTCAGKDAMAKQSKDLCHLVCLSGMMIGCVFAVEGHLLLAAVTETFALVAFLAGFAADYMR